MSRQARICQWCGCGFMFEAAPSSIARGGGRYCTRTCSMRGTLTGKRSRNWKGGRHVKASGHVSIYCPDHPQANANGRVFEHRLVMENHLGRFLDRSEVVHHANRNPLDNRIENLRVMTQGEHIRLHEEIARKEALEFQWYMTA